MEVNSFFVPQAMANVGLIGIDLDPPASLPAGPGTVNAGPSDYKPMPRHFDIGLHGGLNMGLAAAPNSSDYKTGGGYMTHSASCESLTPSRSSGVSETGFQNSVQHVYATQVSHAMGQLSPEMIPAFLPEGMDSAHAAQAAMLMFQNHRLNVLQDGASAYLSPPTGGPSAHADLALHDGMYSPHTSPQQNHANYLTHFHSAQMTPQANHTAQPPHGGNSGHTSGELFWATSGPSADTVNCFANTNGAMSMNGPYDPQAPVHHASSHHPPHGDGMARADSLLSFHGLSLGLEDPAMNTVNTAPFSSSSPSRREYGGFNASGSSQPRLKTRRAMRVLGAPKVSKSKKTLPTAEELRQKHRADMESGRHIKPLLAHIPCSMPGCDKMFMTPLNLKSHLRTHNPDKPFACQEDGCDASFRRHHDLKRHMGSVHTCSRPFTCDRCEKVFARQDALKRHVTRPGTACYNSTSF